MSNEAVQPEEQTPAEVWVVYCTVPDLGLARTLAKLALESKAAACVNILPGVESHYRWLGNLETSNEILLMAKTTSTSWETLRILWEDNHPYGCPEIIALPLAAGHAPYLKWVAAESRD